MILRQWAGCEALPSEGHEPDVVIGTVSDEAHRDFLGRFDAVGLEVHG